MKNDNKIFEMYEKYNLDLNDRIVAFHLLGYIEKSNIGIDAIKIGVKEIDGIENDNIPDEPLADKKTILERCLKYYEEIYARDTDLMNKMLHDEYLLVIREYREKHSERLGDIFRCIEEIMGQI